jgi:hypothetical protein
MAWDANDKAARTKLDMGFKATPWTGKAGVQLRGVPNQERATSLIDVAYVTATDRLNSQAEKDHILSRLTVDISQDTCRNPWHYRFPTLTCSSELYCFRFDRMVTEFEKLVLLGFSKAVNVRAMPQHHVKELAGEAMAVPSVASVLYCTLLCIQLPGFWQHDI